MQDLDINEVNSNNSFDMKDLNLQLPSVSSGTFESLQEPVVETEVKEDDGIKLDKRAKQSELILDDEDLQVNHNNKKKERGLTNKRKRELKREAKQEAKKIAKEQKKQEKIQLKSQQSMMQRGRRPIADSEYIEKTKEKVDTLKEQIQNESNPTERKKLQNIVFAQLMRLKKKKEQMQKDEIIKD